jgi:hypothetical protein
MAPTQFRLHSGRDEETHRVSPARAGRCPADRLIQEQRRPAPDPAGEKRPPWAGRALAGGFGPRAGSDTSMALWQGRWPLPERPGNPDCSGPPLRAESANAPRFPPPARDGAPQTGRSRNNAGQRPTRRARSARRGRGGRWPGALAPGWPRGSAALWQGRWHRPDRTGPVEGRPDFRPAVHAGGTFQQPVTTRNCPQTRTRHLPPGWTAAGGTAWPWGPAAESCRGPSRAASAAIRSRGQKDLAHASAETGLACAARSFALIACGLACPCRPRSLPGLTRCRDPAATGRPRRGPFEAASPGLAALAFVRCCPRRRQRR